MSLNPLQEKKRAKDPQMHKCSSEKYPKDEFLFCLFVFCFPPAPIIKLKYSRVEGIFESVWGESKTNWRPGEPESSRQFSANLSADRELQESSGTTWQNSFSGVIIRLNSRLDSKLITVSALDLTVADQTENKTAVSRWIPADTCTHSLTHLQMSYLITDVFRIWRI